MAKKIHSWPSSVIPLGAGIFDLCKPVHNNKVSAILARNYLCLFVSIYAVIAPVIEIEKMIIFLESFSGKLRSRISKFGREMFIYEYVEVCLSRE